MLKKNSFLGRKKDRKYFFHDTCFGLPRLEPLESCTNSSKLNELKRIRKCLSLFYLEIITCVTCTSLSRSVPFGNS